jgi:hypothetical protein
MIRTAFIVILLALGAKLAFAVVDFAHRQEAARIYILKQSGAQ